MGQKTICFPLPVQPAFERNDSTFAWKSYESGPFHRYAALARSTSPSKAFVQKIYSSEQRSLLGQRTKIECRTPITDYQEGELRSKVQSKMTVSTFLAGFVFTVLANLLMVSGANFTPWQIGATWF